MSYLSPYLEALGSDFTGGANFAVSGSATLPRSAPFSLHVQVQQFLHFKQRSFELLAHGIMPASVLPTSEAHKTRHM